MAVKNAYKFVRSIKIWLQMPSCLGVVVSKLLKAGIRDKKPGGLW